jgi:tetratricopeptide (TPR) repeat protein
MRTPAAADLKKWSDEVARDPASLAFIPLARAYRRQGRREAALRLCLRGLEQHPSNVEGHALLAILYLEGGDRQRAVDEWSIVLSLDPQNFEARRGMGFYHLERNEVEAARGHLELAARLRPEDPAVREAMTVIGDPPGEAGHGSDAPTTGAAAEAPAYAGTLPLERVSRDPLRLFEPLLGEGSFLGAVLLDTQGLTLAGTLEGGEDAEALGAVLGTAIDEAVRTTQYLALGDWRGIMLETEAAVLHITPLPGETVLLMAARRGAPPGWVLRTAARAAELGRRFLEQSP